MTWLGLSPAVLGLTMGGVLVSLAALHLLRVRPRRVRLETLLFARAAAPTPRPVALLGSPSRLLAYLLAAALLGLAVAAAGDPESTADGPSRLVLDQGDAEAAAQAASHGLGPRGGVLRVPGALAARGADLARATSRSGDPESVRIKPESLTTPLVDSRRFAVQIADGLPEAIARVMAVEPLVDATATPAVVMARRGSDPDGAALLIDDGVEPATRRATITPHCPLPLSLRDRHGDNRTALSGLPTDATVWVEDLTTGAPLLASYLDRGRARVVCVSWLLTPLAHRDVPLLIAGTARLLAGPASPSPLSVGTPVSFRGIPSSVLKVKGPETLDIPVASGVATFTPLRVGTYSLDLNGQTASLSVTPAAPVTTSALTTVQDPWRGALTFLIAAVVLVLLDAFWHHRGRLP